MTERPNFETVTDRRVVISRERFTSGKAYTVDVTGGDTYEGTTLNIAGRAAAVGDTLELGGGETEITVRGYDDDRTDGQLLAVGFKTEARL